MEQQPDSVGHAMMTDKWGNPILDDNGNIVNTREYTFTRDDGQQFMIQDHSFGHWHEEGDLGNQGPHFNVRPIENTRTGKVPGTLPHYPFPRKP